MPLPGAPPGRARDDDRGLRRSPAAAARRRVLRTGRGAPAAAAGVVAGRADPACDRRGDSPRGSTCAGAGGRRAAGCSGRRRHERRRGRSARAAAGQGEPEPPPGKFSARPRPMSWRPSSSIGRLLPAPRSPITRGRRGWFTGGSSSMWTTLHGRHRCAFGKVNCWTVWASSWVTGKCSSFAPEWPAEGTGTGR